jgi:hypothetical protein
LVDQSSILSQQLKEPHMAINTQPIFSKQGAIQWASPALNVANTAKDGTGTVASVFTAGVDGAFVQKLVARSIGTNVATVLRVFINNGGVNTTAANNALVAELSLPASTLSEIAAQLPYELPLNLALPAGYKINCTLGTAVTAGYQLSVFGGTYTA